MWVVVCERMNGFWVYPIIGRLGTLEIVIVLAAWVAVLWGIWFVVERVKGKVAGDGKVEKKVN